MCGQESLEVANTYNNQGTVYQSMGQYDKALQAYSKSLNIKIQVGGQEHPHLREDPRTLTSLLDPLRANIMFEFGVCAWLAPLVEEPANSKDPTAPTSRQRREDAPRRANWPQKLTKLRPARHGATAPH